MAKITPDHSYKLVGQFLNNWNLAERMLDSVISTSLRLDIMQSFILSPNIPFGNKIEIAKSLITLSSIDDGEKKNYKRMLNKFLNMSHDRNTIVHNAFRPTEEGDSVKFYSQKTRTKDTVEIPSISWTESDFVSKRTRLMEFAGKLLSLEKRLEESQKFMSLAQVLSDVQPSPYIGPLSQSGMARHLASKSPSSNHPAATPQTSPQTPQEPQASEESEN